MSLTPYDEGFFDGYFGVPQNNPYRKGTGTNPEVETLASQWATGFIAGRAKASFEAISLGTALDRLNNLVRGRL
jgi:hypothetical protein